MGQSEFEKFLTEVRPYLFALSYRVCGDSSDAEDIVQNAMVEAFLSVSEEPETALSRFWIYRFVIDQLRQTLESRPVWKLGDDQIVTPILTDERFWKSLEGERVKMGNGHPSDCRVGIQESLHIGFLTVLQRLPLEDRLVLAFLEGAGFSAEETALVLERRLSEVRESAQRSYAVLDRQYFARDPSQMMWRTEEVQGDHAEKFVAVLNAGVRETFKRSIDGKFRCLLMPSPVFPEEIFFRDFLSQVPECKLLEFQLNGLPAISFQKGKDIEAVAVLLTSKTGVVTLLGYDVDLVSPRIRTRVENHDEE